MTPRTLVPLVAALCVGACGGTSKPAVPPTPTPVKWGATASIPDGKTGTVTLHAVIDSGWHVYSVSQPAGGPTPTRITLAADQGVIASGDVRATPAPQVKYDGEFKMNVEMHERHVQFALPVTVAASAAVPSSVKVNARYQVCNDSLCLPPQTARLTAAVASAKGT